jgi:hypothetical protein
VIRRLVLFATLSIGAVLFAAGPADAGSIICVYNGTPLNIGVCAGLN